VVGKNGVLEHKSGNITETRKDRGRAPVHRAHRAVIFAIAQLSCLSKLPTGLSVHVTGTLSIMKRAETV